LHYKAATGGVTVPLKGAAMAKLNMSGNQGIPKDRLAGNTIGERRQIKQTTVSTQSLPAKPARAKDVFARSGDVSPEEFRKRSDQFSATRRNSKESPYKHVRTEQLEKGATPRATKTITDEARVDFLEKIIKFNITSPAKVRQRFGTTTVSGK
jgi:hypothetical protein